MFYLFMNLLLQINEQTKDNLNYGNARHRSVEDQASFCLLFRIL